MPEFVTTVETKGRKVVTYNTDIMTIGQLREYGFNVLADEREAKTERDAKIDKLNIDEDFKAFLKEDK